MAEFPALEVMTVGTPDLPVGTRIPLTTLPFVIGKSRDNAVPVKLDSIARRHCEVVREHDRWWVRDLGSTNGTLHLGERVHDAELLHGDSFEVGWGICFRLLLHEPVDHRNPELERAILEQPDDAERWSVYADWLQERGDPLGERLAHPVHEEEARCLGPLAGSAGRGELEVVWAHGLPSRVVMRCHGVFRIGWEQRVDTLIRQPQFRFLRALEIDAGSFARENPQHPWGEWLLDRLGLEALPLLEEVAIGPAPAPVDLRPLESRLAARRALFPRFLTTAQRLCFDWGPASLTFGVRVIPLSRLRPFQIGASGGDLALGEGCPSFRLEFVEERWRLAVPWEQSKTVRLNGLKAANALLRPGDVLEPMPGTRLVFAG